MCAGEIWARISPSIRRPTARGEHRAAFAGKPKLFTIAQKYGDSCTSLDLPSVSSSSLCGIIFLVRWPWACSPSDRVREEQTWTSHLRQSSSPRRPTTSSRASTVPSSRRPRRATGSPSSRRQARPGRGDPRLRSRAGQGAGGRSASSRAAEAALPALGALRRRHPVHVPGHLRHRLRQVHRGRRRAVHARRASTRPSRTSRGFPRTGRPTPRRSSGSSASTSARASSSTASIRTSPPTRSRRRCGSRAACRRCSTRCSEQATADADRRRDERVQDRAHVQPEPRAPQVHAGPAAGQHLRRRGAIRPRPAGTRPSSTTGSPR